MVLVSDHLYGSLSKYYHFEKKCTDVTWEINEDPLQINNDELNDIIVTANNTINKRYLALPISQHNYGIIMLTNNEYKLKDLLKLIHDFYKNTDISYCQLKMFSESVEIYEACKQMKNNGVDSVKLKDIIGSPCHFEGFDVATDLSNDIQYTVLLGS